MKLHRTIALAASTAALLIAAGCGGDSGKGDNSSGNGSDNKGSLVLATQDFTEGNIIVAMYSELLTNAGYDVTTKAVTTRDVYLGELGKGGVDIAPEYLAGIADFLNTAQNGESAAPITSNDPDSTLAAAKPLAETAGITLLDPFQATNQNAYFVSQKFADDNNLVTLSDLAALDEPIKLAAAPDCVGRDDCEKGLTDVYGINITEVVPLGFGGAPTKDAVIKGEVQLGQSGTTDGTLADQGLVLLEDDKGIQPAQNLIPAVNSDFLADHSDVADLLNELAAVLTTDDLVELNAQVDVERQQPEDVAKTYLEDKGLL